MKLEDMAQDFGGDEVARTDRVERSRSELTEAATKNGQEP